MRIALLSYRSKPHCGGQGVYIRHLSRELAALGHEVEVFSGQPYPELDAGVKLTKVPSLDLYREPDPFRTPWPKEYRDAIDVLEVATMWTAGFPEPRTFSMRVARLLKERLDDFDVVHDNQTLGYGMLDIERAGLPLITTIHHPITFDRRVDLAAAKGIRKKLSLRRWYGFLQHAGQGRPSARPHPHRVGELARATSRSTSASTGRGSRSSRSASTRSSSRPTEPRVPGRIVAMASADTPMKGIATLLEAFAKLRTERDVELLLVTRPKPGGQTEKLIDRLAISDSVRFVNGITDAQLAEIVASGRDRLRALALRGLLAADRRGDGLRDAARGQPRRRHPRGRRARGPVRRPGHARATWASSCTRSRTCSTTPSAGPAWARPAGSARWPSTAGTPSPRPPPRPTGTSSARGRRPDDRLQEA